MQTGQIAIWLQVSLHLTLADTASRLFTLPACQKTSKSKKKKEKKKFFLHLYGNQYVALHRDFAGAIITFLFHVF